MFSTSKFLFPVFLLMFVGITAHADDRLHRTGLAWRVLLSHDDVQKLKESKDFLAFVPEPEIKTAIELVINIIDFTNEIGGRKGVEITGAHGVPGIFIYPQGRGSLYTWVVEAVKKAGNTSPS